MPRGTACLPVLHRRVITLIVSTSYQRRVFDVCPYIRCLISTDNDSLYHGAPYNTNNIGLHGGINSGSQQAVDLEAACRVERTKATDRWLPVLQEWLFD